MSEPQAPAPAAAASSLKEAKELIGRIVNGKYEVQSILGEGGMGIVYKVRHLILQHKNTFALKILHPRLCAQPDFQTRFLREVEIAMELTHENIVQIRDFGLTEQSLLFYTMDYFAGASLKDILEKEGAMAPERVARIARQILAALAEAHKLGIIHRDLKPENLLIQKVDAGTDDVRILDFGIAKVMVDGGEEGSGAHRENLTQGNAIGTPRYMSPEQASSEHLDHRSDLYSLGCILYEMLCGHTPFSGKTTRTILMAHLTTPPPALDSRRPGLTVPQALERLVYQLLAKNPDERPASATEVIDMLAGRASQPPAGTPARPARRSTPAIVWGAAAALALGAGAAVVVAPWPKPSPAAASAPPAPEPAAPRRSPAAAPSAAVKLRCNVCNAVYAKGQKVGDMCHGEPLIEVR